MAAWRVEAPLPPEQTGTVNVHNAGAVNDLRQTLGGEAPMGRRTRADRDVSVPKFQDDDLPAEQGGVLARVSRPTQAAALKTLDPSRRAALLARETERQQVANVNIQARARYARMCGRAFPADHVSRARAIGAGFLRQAGEEGPSLPPEVQPVQLPDAQAQAQLHASTGSSRSNRSTLSLSDHRVMEKERQRMLYARFMHAAAEREREETAKMERALLQRQEAREAEFERLNRAVEEGRAFDAEVGHYMSVAQAKEERQQRERHEEWRKEVAAPIHRSVHAMLSSEAYQQLRRSKGQRYRDYVEGRGGKRAFLDATTQEEMRHPTGLRAPVAPLHRDPTIRSVVKSAEERLMLESAGEQAGARAPSSRRQTASSQASNGGSAKGSVTGEGAPQPQRSTRALIAARPKSTLDTRVWATGKIEATPHGHQVKSGTAAPGVSALYDSGRVQRAMDQFAVAHGKDVADAEWPFRGRRTHAAVLERTWAEAGGSKE